MLSNTLIIRSLVLATIFSPAAVCLAGPMSPAPTPPGPHVTRTMHTARFKGPIQPAPIPPQPGISAAQAGRVSAR